MTEQGRPTLTLRRKAEPEGQRAVSNSEPDGAGPGRVTRKKTVVVNTTPAWKVRKQAVDESAKKAQADEKAARKAEKARQWAERQAQEREAMRAARRKPAPEPVYRKVMPLTDALALLERCWPALVTDGQPQLLAVNIREAMVSPSRMVIRFARTFCAVSDREFSTPHSRIRFPNMRNPISATAWGATRPTMTVTVMGNRIFVVLETGRPL